MKESHITPKLRISVTVEMPGKMHENGMTFHRRLTDEEALEAFKEIWRQVTDVQR